MRRFLLLLPLLLLLVAGGVLVGPRAVSVLASFPRYTPGSPAYLGIASEEPCNLDTSSLCFLAIGDTGIETPERDLAIELLEGHMQEDTPDFIFLLGDNFYPDGVTSVSSPRFDSDFEEVFSLERFDLPFHVALGNHDHQGDIQAQIDYSGKSERWSLPAAQYQFDVESPDGAVVALIVIDTMPLVDKKSTTGAQLDWLAARLADSRADWKIVVGHHPVVSAGKHGSSKVLMSNLKPVLLDGGADLYLSGHEHDLQLLRTEDGLLQAISGAGAKLRRTSRIDATLYSEPTVGFFRVRASKSRLCLTSITDAGEQFEHHVDR